MIVTELRLINFVLIIFLLTSSRFLVNAVAIRCYLCSQNTLAECAGNVAVDSPMFTTVMQYYTEPCNGQCVLFRNEKTSTIRGCSWTYGHMTPKSTGWHELSPGIQAYFCDSYLCNNGTFEQPETPLIRAGVIHDEVLLTPSPTLSPAQLFIMSGNTPPIIQTDQGLSPINGIPRQFRQCYVCTARVTGCGEHLDPRFASKYIQPCTSSCIIFRNPNDHYLITRDCSTYWPQVHAKSGLHKLLGSDAFFCQESLCNGISFDFIMGIFHNQLPAVITFPPTRTIEDTLTTTINHLIPLITPSTPSPSRSTINIEDDNVIWEDPDLDFVMVEPMTTTLPIPSTSSPFLSTEVPDDSAEEYELSTTTTLPIPSTSSPFLSAEVPEDIADEYELSTTTTLAIPSTSSLFSTTEFLDDTDEEYESSTIPSDVIEHFDFVENIPASSTIPGGMAVAEDDSSLNWWDLNESSIPPPTEPMNSLLTATVATHLLPFNSSTTKLSNLDEDDWTIFHTNPLPSFEHFSDANSEVDFDMNDIFFFPTLSTASTVDSTNNQTPSFVPHFFPDSQAKEQLLGLLRPISTLAMPPFSWMLHLAMQNKSKPISRKNLGNQNFTGKRKKKKRVDLQKTLNNNHDHFYAYCKKKQCQHGGRLNSDCLCICLPAFSGNNCERIHCHQEPAHICDFVLDDECKIDHIRYLCPRFCQMNICSSEKSS